jgi:steroid delta-isomerase-like uncharacterized protein
MSRQSTENLIRAYLDAANQSDNDAIIALMDEDVVFEVNQGMRQVGTDNLRFLLANKVLCTKEQLADAVIMSSADGACAAAEFTWKGSYIGTIPGFPNATGQRFSLKAAITFEVEDGKFTRITSWRDMKEWLKQISEE